MRPLLLTLLAPFLLLIPLQAAAAADEDIEYGRAMAERLCAVCHMNPGQGEKAAVSGVPSFNAVANRPTQTFEGVQAWLQSIPPMMPNHHLTREEIHNLASFIMSMRGNP